jgi:hypothetical protein
MLEFAEYSHFHRLAIGQTSVDAQQRRRAEIGIE